MSYYNSRLRIPSGSFVNNNPLLMWTQSGITISSTTQASANSVEYTADNNNNPFVRVYATGGIWNKVPNQRVRVVLTGHIPVTVTPSGQFSVGATIQQQSQGGSYAHNLYLGYYYGISTVYVEFTIFVAIPSGGAIRVCLYKTGSTGSTQKISTSGHVQIQPFSIDTP